MRLPSAALTAPAETTLQTAQNIFRDVLTGGQHKPQEMHRAAVSRLAT